MATNEELAHFMGTKVGKVFPGYGDEPFRGKVAEIDISDGDGRCFRIDYEDGDCEWMTLEELLEFRVSPDGSGPPTPLSSGRKAARPAGAARRGRGGKPRTPGRDAAARGGSAEADAVRKKRGRPPLAKKMALAAKEDGATGSGSDKEDEGAAEDGERPGKRARAAAAAGVEKDASGLSDQEAGKAAAAGDEAAAPAADEAAAPAPADMAAAAACPKAAAAAKQRSTSPAPATAASLKKSAAAKLAEAKQVASKIAAAMRPGNNRKRLAALAGLPDDPAAGDAAAAAPPSTCAAAAAGAAEDASAAAAGSGAEAGGSGASTPLRPNSNAARLLAAAKAQGTKSKLGGRGGAAGEGEDASKPNALPPADAPEEAKVEEKRQPQKRQQQQKKQQQQQEEEEKGRDEEMEEQPPSPSPQPRETKAPAVKKEASAVEETAANATASNGATAAAGAEPRLRPLLPKSSPGMAGGEVAYVTVQPRSVAEAGLSPADVDALRRGDDPEAVHQAYATATAACLRSAGRLLDQLSAKRSTLLTATAYLRDVEGGASGFTEAWNAWLGACEAPGVMVLQGHGPVPDVPVLLQMTAFAADEGEI